MTKRLHFIDVLRGIAACAVLCQHLFEVRSAGFINLSSNYFQSGVFGVSLFFVISGFIIPYALEKSSSISVFWIRRLFRIYPLYLFCLVLFMAIGIYHGQHFHPLQILLNLLLVNEPASWRIIGLSWTLTFEVIFYILLSGLFLVKMDKNSLRNCFLLVAIALLLAVVKHSYAAVVMLYFVLFFSGNIFHKFYRHEIAAKFFYPAFLFLLLAIALINFYGLIDVADPALGSRVFLPRTSANCLALILFLMTLQFRHLPIMSNKFLFLLGEISYSIYLMQTITLPLANNCWLIGIIATLLLASATHYLIEKPFINYGHRLSQKFVSRRKSVV